MKKSLVVSLLALLLSFSATAQNGYMDACNTPNSWFSLVSDTLGAYLHIDTTQVGNIWQFGLPQKPAFTLSHPTDRGLMTDTLNPYPVNNTSSFGFSAIECNGNGPYGFYWYAIVVSMHLIVDTDTLKDGGTIEVRHQGQDWINLLEDSSLGYFPIECYTQNDTVEALGEPGFSGKKDIYMDFFMNMNHNGFAAPIDTIDFRITFASDSTHSGKSGVLIESLGLWYYTESVDPVAAASLFSLSPNPASSHVRASFLQPDQHWATGTFTLLNPLGQEVRQIRPQGVETDIFTGDLSAGLYLLRYTGNGVTACAKVEIQ